MLHPTGQHPNNAYYSFISYLEFVGEDVAQVARRVDAVSELVGAVTLDAVQRDRVEDLQHEQAACARVVRRPPSHHLLVGQQVAHARVPAAAPQHHVEPRRHHHHAVLERHLRRLRAAAVQARRHRRRRPLQREQQRVAGVADDQRGKFRGDRVGRVEERVQHIPDAAPDAHVGRDDDELAEGRVEDVGEGERRLEEREETSFTLYTWWWVYCDYNSYCNYNVYWTWPTPIVITMCIDSIEHGVCIIIVTLNME